MTFSNLFSNQTKYKNLRKILRNKTTKGERLLWWKLKDKQIKYKFRRQFNIDNYMVDFYCHELKLIIEIDGYSHYNEEQYNKDKERQKYLEQNKLKIIRYTEKEVVSSLNKIVEDIYNQCEIRQNELNNKTLPLVGGD